MKIYMIQALDGDCFVIDFDNGKCIQFDGEHKLSPISLHPYQKNGAAIFQVAPS